MVALRRRPSDYGVTAAARSTLFSGSHRPEIRSASSSASISGAASIARAGQLAALRCALGLAWHDASADWRRMAAVQPRTKHADVN